MCVVTRALKITSILESSRIPINSNDSKRIEEYYEVDNDSDEEKATASEIYGQKTLKIKRKREREKKEKYTRNV